ncbi:MAG: PilZ domain-containing protein [Bryobacterales bacterium]|nr:PilZ domain-containing protein [Bryobacterales bacterium]
MMISRSSNKDDEINGSMRYGKLAELLSFDPSTLAEDGLRKADSDAPPATDCAVTEMEEEPLLATPAPPIPSLERVDNQVVAAPPPNGTPAVSEPVQSSVTAIHRAAEQMAESLVATIKEAASDVYRRAELDRLKLEAALESIERTKADVGRACAELTVLHEVTELISETGQQQGAKLAALDERILRAEDATKQAQQKAEEMLRAQDTASESLRASLERMADLERRLGAGLDRLEAVERAIQTVTVEAEQHAALWARFMGSLRTLDMRTEKRFPVKEPVQVVVAGDPSTKVTGHIANVSDNGLGLMLDTSLPVGSALQIEVDGTRLSGTVRHSRASKGGHAVGVALTEPLRLPVAGAH